LSDRHQIHFVPLDDADDLPPQKLLIVNENCGIDSAKGSAGTFSPLRSGASGDLVAD
jgi:hypothetical protein